MNEEFIIQDTRHLTDFEKSFSGFQEKDVIKHCY